MALCPHCHEQVHPKATRCPHCAGKIEHFTAVKVIGSLLLVCSVVYCSDRVSRESPKPTQTATTDYAKLKSEGLREICNSVYTDRTPSKFNADVAICEAEKSKSKLLKEYDDAVIPIVDKFASAYVLRACKLRDATWYAAMARSLNGYLRSPRVLAMKALLGSDERLGAERYITAELNTAVDFQIGLETEPKAGACADIAQQPWVQNDASFLPFTPALSQPAAQPVPATPVTQSAPEPEPMPTFGDLPDEPPPAND